MDDVRYSEFIFLQALAARSLEVFDCNDQQQQKVLGLGQVMYIEMAADLIENLYIRFQDQNAQLLVAQLRGELSKKSELPPSIPSAQWYNPRAAILHLLLVGPLQRIYITYRGLRRIEELRDLLRRDRILEDFGILLSLRYFRRDVTDALQRSSDVPVSVLCADMDNFGIINKRHGQAAGDVVMKAYLEAVRDCLGSLGTGYRGVGDETYSLIIGQGHDYAVSIAESIRGKVEATECDYNGTKLPKVTVSIGVATTPPEARTMDIETAAEYRKRQAKEKGKNCVMKV